MYNNSRFMCPIHLLRRIPRDGGDSRKVGLYAFRFFMSWCVRVCSSHYSNRFDPNHNIICALLYKVANNPIRHQLPIITKGKDEKIN